MDDYPGMNITINAGREDKIHELFVKPVTRYSVSRPYRMRPNEPNNPEPTCGSWTVEVAAYWCPSLALIRLATMRYSRPEKWGPVITVDVPDSDYAGTNRYTAITMGITAIEEAEHDNPGSFIEGHYTEEAAWDAWNAKSAEERAGTDGDGYDDVPFD